MMNPKSAFESQVQTVISLFTNGKLNEALKINKDLIKKYPNEPVLFNICGACYFGLDEHQLAVNSFKKAISINPNYAEAYYNSGNSQRLLGHLKEAVKSYQSAIKIKSNYPQAHNNLGVTFQDLGMLADAINSYEWAIAYKYDYAEAFNNLGNVQRELNQLDLGIKNLTKAISFNTNYAEAHKNLGNALQEKGNYEEALKSYEAALKINPNYALAHYDLSFLKNYMPDDPQINQIKSLLDQEGLSQTDQIHLNFALAKMNNDLKKYDLFFHNLHEGNRLRKEELNYSFENSKNLISIIKGLFINPDEFKKISSSSSKNCPIFIVGMPRSGTTLVEQIIASHHEVYGAGELNALAQCIEPILNQADDNNQNKLTNKEFISIQEKYLNSITSLNISERIFTDKMPLNFQYIGFILLAFPGAKIVHLKRDARAVCWSIYKHYFNSSGNGWAYNLDDLARFYSLYADLMDFWHQMFPGQIYDISYEELTTNQKEETSRLLEYCGLEWDDNCLNFHKSKRAVSTASAVQVRQKMYQGSSEAWKKYDTHLEPLIKALNSF